MARYYGLPECTIPGERVAHRSSLWAVCGPRIYQLLELEHDNASALFLLHLSKGALKRIRMGHMRELHIVRVC